MVTAVNALLECAVTGLFAALFLVLWDKYQEHKLLDEIRSIAESKEFDDE